MRAAARGEHFGDEQAREDAVFLRNVAADREPGAFFAAHRDFVFADELADVFEADGSLISGLAVGFRGGVDHLRCGDAAGGGHFPAARFDEVVVDESEDVIGRDPGAVAIDDAEAIGVAVGGEARGGFGFFHGVAERSEIFFGDVGAGAVEERVAIGAHRGDFDAVIGENFVEIACAAAVQGVDDEFRFAFFEDVEFDEFAEALEIVVAKIDHFGFCVFVARRLGDWSPCAASLAARASMSLVTSGSAGPASGPENFRP